MPENKPMQDKLNRGALIALVASLLAAPVMAEPPVTNDAAMQLLQRVNDLERELSNLRGENEKLRNDLDNVQKDQKTGFEQVDERMEKLKDQPKPSTDTPSSASISSSTNSDTPKPDDKIDTKLDSTTPSDSSKSSTDSTLTSSPSSTTDSKPSDSSKSSTDSTLTSSSSSTTDKATTSSTSKDDPNGFYSYGTGKSDNTNPATTSTDSKSAPSISSSSSDTKPTDAKTDAKTDSKVDGKLPEREERAAYDEAFQTLLKEPKSSIPLFRTFLKDYPSSSLAPSAQYWIGEALYAEKDFTGAIAEFLLVLKEHKGSDKAPDAALKLGYSFYELKEWEKARKTLEDVVSFFPDNAEVAQKAKDRLEKMKGEGH
jgi:tol-pal system protein YbgF